MNDKYYSEFELEKELIKKLKSKNYECMKLNNIEELKNKELKKNFY